MWPDDPIPALKRQVAAELAQVVARGNGDDLGASLRTDRSRIADLRHGKLDRFSLDRLIRFAHELNYDVTIQLTRRRVNQRRDK